MTPSVGKKISLLSGFMVLIATGTVAAIAYLLIQARLTEVLRKDTLDAATLLSSRVRNELKHVAEKGRIFTAASLEEFRNPDDQIRFLEDNLSMDDQLLAMTLYRRSVISHGEWVPVFRLTRKSGDLNHLTESDFKALDLKSPIELNNAGKGEVDIVVGQLKDETPLLRIAVPLVKKAGGLFSQVILMELRQDRIMGAFAEATSTFSFILDRNGRLISQTDPSHFTYGEDLSNLPIFQMERTTESENGNLDYYEYAGGTLQYGSFHKVGFADLIVVSQTPKTYVTLVLRKYTSDAIVACIACSFLAMAFTLLGTFGILGIRLGKILSALERVKEGKYSVNFPEKHSPDEIGTFARKLQSLFDQLKERDRAHGTFVKLKNSKAKSKIESGKIKLKGERLDAVVLHCHLHGIDLVVKAAPPELLIQLLNKFNQSVSDEIEAKNGIVDTIHSGSVVAYWGVPLSDSKDVDHAVSTAIRIRDFARLLNDELRSNELPKVRLGMGIHFGPVVAGQVGTEDRMEYTAIGEALEVAGRIHSFTDQFGTDLLITEQAAAQAPGKFKLEQTSAGDEDNPGLFELIEVEMPDNVEQLVQELPVTRKRGRPKKLAA